MGVQFSIVVTTHHRPLLLKRCLQSILEQDIDNYEIVLCADEGSVETKRVATDYLRSRDKFLVLPGSKGPSATRNFGIQFASGQKILFCDDDDGFDPDFINKLTNSIDFTLKDTVYYTNYVNLYEMRHQNSFETLRVCNVFTGMANVIDIFKGNLFPINSLVFDTSSIRNEKFDTELRSHEDWDFLLKIFKNSRFVHLDLYGPKIYITESPTRNSGELPLKEMAFDFQKIYMRYPSPNLETLQFRKNIINSLGLIVPDPLL